MSDVNPLHKKNRTFVLLHGAYHGGWCWRDLANNLRSQGHEVYTPTLTGLGDRSHLIRSRPNLEVLIDDVAQVFKFEDLTEVVLVGHSFGGIVVTALADRLRSQIGHLVYLDATVLRSGERATDRMPPELVQSYAQRAASTGGESVAPNPPETFGITDPAMAAWLKAKLTAQPYQPYLDRIELKNPVGNGLPVTYIACTNPIFASLHESRAIAQTTPGWRYIELSTGHNAMMTAKDELADILCAAQ